MITMNDYQCAYRAAHLVYERKLREVSPLIDHLLDTWPTPLETPEQIEAYAEQEAAIHLQVGTTQAREALRQAEQELLNWGLACLKMYPDYKLEIEHVFQSNLLSIRQKTLELCIRLD